MAELTKARLSKRLVVGSNPLWHAYKRVGPSSSSCDTLSLFYKQRIKKETSRCLSQIIQKRLVVA